MCVPLLLSNLKPYSTSILSLTRIHCSTRCACSHSSAPLKHLVLQVLAHIAPPTLAHLRERVKVRGASSIGKEHERDPSLYHVPPNLKKKPGVQFAVVPAPPQHSKACSQPNKEDVHHPESHLEGTPVPARCASSWDATFV